MDSSERESLQWFVFGLFALLLITLHRFRWFIVPALLLTLFI